MGERTAEGKEVTTGQLCRALTHSLGEWQDSPNGRPRSRGGVWNHWPFQYIFKEFEGSTTFGAIYQLSSLSVTRVDSGLCEYRVRYIGADGELLAVIGVDVDPEHMDTATMNQLSETAQFEAENGFTEPNEEDILELHWSLEQGFMDGVTAV